MARKKRVLTCCLFSFGSFFSDVSLVAHQSSDSLFYPTAQSGIDSSESTFSVSSGSNQASPPQQLMRRLTGGPQPAPTWSSTTALAMMLKRSCPILLSAKLVCSALLLCGLIKTSKIPALAGLISLSASCDMVSQQPNLSSYKQSMMVVSGC